MHPPDTVRDDGFETLASVPRRLSRRLQIALVAVLVVVGGVFAVRRLTASDPPARITMYGLPVADPAGVLHTAQERFERYVAEQHGARAADASCWFERRAGSADVDGTLLCGPVQFYGDDPNRPYLPFKLTATASNPVQLAVPDAPVAPASVAAPHGTTLIRPEGTATPLSVTTVVAPDPPAADAHTLTMTDAVYPADLGRVPPTAVIGSETITVQLVAGGPVLSFGTGAAARSAPPGMQLYAFGLVFSGGENGFARLSHLDIGVAVGTAAARPLRLPDSGVNASGQLFVVATTPTSPLHLVLTERGVTQRLSLRTGAPDRHNISYLRTVRRLDVVPVEGRVPATVTIGDTRMTTTVYAALTSGTREFFLPGSGAHPSRTDHVFLLLDLWYWLAEVPGRHFFRATDVTLTPRHGSPIRPQGMDLFNGAVFDVPTGMTDATITIRGVEQHPHYSLSVRSPVTLPVHLADTRQ